MRLSRDRLYFVALLSRCHVLCVSVRTQTSLLGLIGEFKLIYGSQSDVSASFSDAFELFLHLKQRLQLEVVDQ